MSFKTLEKDSINMFYYAVPLGEGEWERSSKIRVPLKKAQHKGRIEMLLSKELIVKTDRSQGITQVICKRNTNFTFFPLKVCRARANTLLAVLASHR